MLQLDSVSLLKFPFLCYVRVFLCEILPVCSLKYPYSCFYSYFCFLVIVFLFIFTFSAPFLFAVISPLPLPFLDSHRLPMLSLGCKTLWIVIKSLVFWSIYLSSSLVHFKNGPDYLTKETVLVFFSLMRFLLQSLVSRSFLVHLKYSFYFFFHLHLFDGGPLPKFYFFPLFVFFLFSL